MVCGRRTGEWTDEVTLVVSTCWLEVGHRWECHDKIRGLRWTPGDGVDSTGVRYLIDLADAGLVDDATDAVVA